MYILSLSRSRALPKWMATSIALFSPLISLLIKYGLPESPIALVTYPVSSGGRSLSGLSFIKTSIGCFMSHFPLHSNTEVVALGRTALVHLNGFDLPYGTGNLAFTSNSEINAFQN